MKNKNNKNNQKNKNNKNNQKILEMIEDVLRNRVLDITDEYQDECFVSGISVFIGEPIDILNEIKDKLNQLT